MSSSIRPLHLLFIVQNYPPERGPVRYTHGVACAMSALGHRVTVITGLPHYPHGKPYPGYGRLKPATRLEDGVRVIRLPMVMSSNAQILQRVLGFLTFAVIAFIWQFAVRHPDVIIASVPPVTTSLTGYLTSVVRRKPLVLVLRDVEPFDSIVARGFKNSPLLRFFELIFKKIYGFANRLVIIHPNQRNTLLQAGVKHSRTSLIPHAIDVDRFNRGAEVPSSIKLPHRDGRHLMLYAGTIGVNHDLQGYLVAFADSRIRSLPIDLAVVGDGECCEVCRSLVKKLSLDNVSFFQPVNLSEVPNLLSQADLLLFSIREGVNPVVGSKTYEYCAAGKPVLVYGDCEGGRLIEEIGNGWLCRTRDSARLFEVLSSYLQDSATATINGRLGTNHMRENYSTHRSASHWNSLLALLVHHR